MKPTAIGRVLVWRGGSLWIGRAGEPAEIHAHHAIQISLPFPGGHLRFRQPGKGWKTYTGAIVAAHQPHEFEARRQLVAQIFAEPESLDGRVMQLRHRDEGISALAQGSLHGEIAALAAAYKARADDAELVALAQAAISRLADSSSTPKPVLDRRIEHAVKLVREHLDEAVHLGEIASAVNLSPERFRHLFVEQTGVRFRAYILWLRLECALSAYVAGKSLTEAAYSGGFADSAHLSRTFKRMFGISAASIHLE